MRDVRRVVLLTIDVSRIETATAQDNRAF